MTTNTDGFATLSSQQTLPKERDGRGSLPLPTLMPFSNGTFIDDDGRVQSLAVANSYVPIAGDVFINGTLHRSSDGAMYHTVGALLGASDVFINGILHTSNGVRYSVNGSGVNDWPEGFATDVNGRQCNRTIQIGSASIRGIARQITTRRMNIQAAAGADLVNVTNATIQEFSAAPTLGEKEAGYEVQNNGNTVAVTNEDNGAGPPTFNTLNILTDWIDNKSYSGTYHARFTQTGGSGSLVNSAPLNVWREIGVDSAIWLLGASNGAGFQDFIGTIAISDDGGSTTLDSATLTFETDEI